MNDRIAISHAEFKEVCDNENCRANSQHFRPLEHEQIWRISASVRELLLLPLYPVWYLGATGGDFRHSHDPAYNRILFRDALERDDFRSECLEDRHPTSQITIPTNLIGLHCTTCGNFALIDGNHRLTRLALGLIEPGLNAQVILSVLSGSRWGDDVPDMNKVCACLAP